MGEASRSARLRAHYKTMEGPSTAEDYALVCGVLEDISQGQPRSFHDAERALEAVQRLKAKHQRYLDAAAAVSELANKAHEAKEQLEPGKVREALGAAYMGGPLL